MNIGKGAVGLMASNILSMDTLAATGRRPNVVFILIDDFGWKDTGVYGGKFYRTPNIDKLAAQGMRFTDAYAACPACSPTRASIMTGRDGEYLTDRLTDEAERFIEKNKPKMDKNDLQDRPDYAAMIQYKTTEHLSMFYRFVPVGGGERRARDGKTRRTGHRGRHDHLLYVRQRRSLPPARHQQRLTARG